MDGFEIAGLQSIFLEATNAVGRRAERIVAAEQNLRYWATARNLLVQTRAGHKPAEGREPARR
jgi:hypothetical protein